MHKKYTLHSERLRHDIDGGGSSAAIIMIYKLVYNMFYLMSDKNYE